MEKHSYLPYSVKMDTAQMQPPNPADPFFPPERSKSQEHLSRFEAAVKENKNSQNLTKSEEITS